MPCCTLVAKGVTQKCSDCIHVLQAGNGLGCNGSSVTMISTFSGPVHRMQTLLGASLAY